MCGICGTFNFNGAPVRQATLEAAMSAIAHRGPDGRGLHLDGAVGLGHLRLSIIDLSDAGNQPMATEDQSTWIVFNGEIYNYQALREMLEKEGERFRSGSDTEVLLRLYQRRGAACLEVLEGMFAFAIWNRNDRTLFLARDRLGIKPLYYYLDEERIVFASEIKAILEDPRVPREVDQRALITYMTFGHSFAPQTIYRGISKLRPGHFLLCTPDKHESKKYWDVDTVQQHGSVDEAATLAELRTRLDAAVTSHMVSDVPVGAFLSGGVDSSAIVAGMARASSQKVKTFTIGFDVGGEFNELEEARLIAKKFDTDHHEKIVTELDVQNLIEKLVYHYDEPFADAANLPTYMVSQFAREHVKVVLSGEGGDEVFGGYRRYRAHLLSSRLRRIPSVLRHAVASKVVPVTPRTRRLRKIIETLEIVEPARRYGNWVNVFTDPERRQLFTPAVQQTLAGFDGYDVFRDYMGRGQNWDLTNHILYTDLKGWMPDTYLEKIDKAAMSVGLEGRVPFLDHRLVEFAYSLPGSLKVHGSETKYVLKKALEPVLPHSTLYRPKHGFSVPLNAWFRGRLQHFLSDVLLDGSPRYAQYLERKFVQKLFEQHIAGERDWGTQLWTILNFELWNRRFLG